LLISAYSIGFITIGWVSVQDLIRLKIPDRVLLPGTALTVSLLAGSAAIRNETDLIINSVTAAISSAAFYLLLHLVTNKAIGFGDVKLGFLVGFLVGWSSFSAAMLAITIAFLGAGVAAILLQFTRLATGTTTLPLAPFMSIGALMAFVR
jgi:leader peptidase (prepilin peptidase)/N-methyltransferase